MLFEWWLAGLITDNQNIILKQLPNDCIIFIYHQNRPLRNECIIRSLVVKKLFTSRLNLEISNALRSFSHRPKTCKVLAHRCKNIYIRMVSILQFLKVKFLGATRSNLVRSAKFCKIRKSRGINMKRLPETRFCRGTPNFLYAPGSQMIGYIFKYNFFNIFKFTHVTPSRLDHTWDMKYQYACPNFFLRFTNLWHMSFRWITYGSHFQIQLSQILYPSVTPSQYDHTWYVKNLHL